MNNEVPLVTVNILSYNRKKELKNTLTKVYEQDYKNIEVIVVDNASNDGTVEMVEKEFPEVILIRMEKNVGIAGWNEGFKIAKGEYVLVLDDDCYPDNNSLTKAVELVNNNKTAGAVAFNIYNLFYNNNKMIRFPGGWLPNDDVAQCNWKFFVGCAFLIRRNLFFENLFPPGYFICFHEIPIIRSITSRNFLIVYDRELKAFHQNQKLQNISSLREFYNYRNMLNFFLWNLKFPLNLIYCSRLFIFYSSRSIKNKWFLNFLKSLKFLRTNLQGYELPKMNWSETKSLLDSGFIEYKISRKIFNIFKPT